MEFDPVTHETRIADRYEQLARISAFDAFIDMALDGCISLEEAIAGFTEEYGDYYKIAPEEAI